MGVSAGGISVFDGHARVDGFLWARILKLSFKRNLFYVQLKTEVLLFVLLSSSSSFFPFLSLSLSSPSSLSPQA